MPHYKDKYRLDELDEEWLAEQDVHEKCKCGRRPIWLLLVSSNGIRNKRTVGPFCNFCVKREFESS